MKNKLQEYIKERIRIENKYCLSLPLYDSCGRYCGGQGSFIDKTGKFDPKFQIEISELDKKYNLPCYPKSD